MESGEEHCEERTELRDMKSGTVLYCEFANEYRASRGKSARTRYAAWSVEDGRDSSLRSDDEAVPVYRGCIGHGDCTEFSDGYHSLRALVEDLAPASPVIAMSEELVASLSDGDLEWLVGDPACALDAIVLATANSKLHANIRKACELLMLRVQCTTCRTDLDWL